MEAQMSQEWLDAAKLYRQQKAEKDHQEIARQQKGKEEKEARQKEAEAIKNAAETGEVRRIKGIELATSQLRRFLKSPKGRAALSLLDASGNRIVFGQEQDGGEVTDIFIDGRGLCEFTQDKGLWRAFAKAEDVPKPKTSFVTPREAIKAAVFFEGREPEKIMPWLYGELNKIAKAANP